MSIITYSTVIIFYFSIDIMINCASLSVINRLKNERTIEFQSKFSSPIEINLNEDSKFEITCSFLSNYQTVDIFWLHNGTLIQSFTSKVKSEEKDNRYLSVSIVSKLILDRIHFDIHGFYQCIAAHKHVYAQQIFNVKFHSTKNDSLSDYNRKSFFFTVHTSEALFEPRDYLVLMCRSSNSSENQCQIQWFDSNEHQLGTFHNQTDLIIQNATFDDHMGLYKCRICCFETCQDLSSFVYRTEHENLIN